MNFQGKTALVIGGTSGIGLEIARALVRYGARVAVTGRDPQRLEHARALLGPQAIAIRADACSIGDNRRMRAELEQSFGGLDIVFANAGIEFSECAGQAALSEENPLTDVNFDGIYFSVQSAVSIMRSGGSIILNASWLNDAGMVGPALLSAAKAVVRSLARCLSAELASRQIRVNAVGPGALDKPRTEGAAAPVRSQSARDIVEAVLFLASDYSRFMLGAEVVDAGGFSCI